MKTTSRLRSPAARRAPFPGPGVAYCPAGFSACPQAPETDMIPVMLRLLAALLSLLTWLAGSPAQRAVPGQTALHITIYIARYRTGEDSDRSSSYQHRIRATDKTLTFGKRFTLSGGNPARRDPTFQQRTYDAGLGIYDYRNRSFDPATGRFLQRDPVLDGNNLYNPYAAMGNNPVGNVDPMGLWKIQWELMRIASDKKDDSWGTLHRELGGVSGTGLKRQAFVKMMEREAGSVILYKRNFVPWRPFAKMPIFAARALTAYPGYRLNAMSPEKRMEVLALTKAKAKANVVVDSEVSVKEGMRQIKGHMASGIGYTVKPQGVLHATKENATALALLPVGVVGMLFAPKLAIGGALIGAGIGALDAWTGGEDVKEGTAKGAVTGLATWPVAGAAKSYRAVRIGGSLLALGGSALGVKQSYDEGKYGQMTFRGFLMILSGVSVTKEVVPSWRSNWYAGAKKTDALYEQETLWGKLRYEIGQKTGGKDPGAGDPIARASIYAAKSKFGWLGAICPNFNLGNYRATLPKGPTPGGRWLWSTLFERGAVTNYYGYRLYLGEPEERERER